MLSGRDLGQFDIPNLPNTESGLHVIYAVKRLHFTARSSKVKMHIISTSPLKWLILLAIPVLLVVVVLDVDSWGTFLLDVAFTLFVQIAIALMIFVWLVVVVDIVKGALNSTSLSQSVMRGIFLISVIMVLPLIGILFRRPVDYYDIAQTVLIITFGLLFEPLRHSLGSLKTSSAPYSPAYKPTTSTVGMPQHANPELYKILLSKARGDEGLTQRLIEYERKRLPHASQDELVRSAIERWERDNR